MDKNESENVDTLDKSEADTSDPVALKDVSVRITRSIFIRISTIAAIILFIVSATWGITKLFIIDPKNETLTLQEQDIEKNNIEIEGLEEKYASLYRDFTEIKKLSKVPTLLNPVSGKHISGRYITFRWKYDVNPGFQNFVLELRHIEDNGNILTRRYQIPDASRKKMDFELPAGKKGEFYWRIGTGEMLTTENNKSQKTSPVEEFVDYALDREASVFRQSDTRLWSRYGNFHVHNSVYDKIETTGEIAVGMTAIFLSYDHTIDCQGRPNTFDMDFIEWISVQLEDKYMHTPVKVVRTVYKWDELLSAVHIGEVDVALANITRSKDREDMYPGLKFTVGYRDNYQRIIFSRHHKSSSLFGKNISIEALKKELTGATLATQDKTINKQAAEFIKDKFGFKHDYNYSSYVDVIDAVRRGKVDFGMIDSVRIETVDYPEIAVVEFDINPLLKEMYQRTSGSDTESYGIAVHADSSESKLLKTLNKIIEIDEWDAMRKKIIEENSLENMKNPGVC